MKWAQEIFDGDGTKGTVKKIVCGAQHTVALSCSGDVFTCGDSHTGKLGRPLIRTRRRSGGGEGDTGGKKGIETTLKKISARNVRDIFCGKYHSFYLSKNYNVFAWGMNNHG